MPIRKCDTPSIFRHKLFLLTSSYYFALSFTISFMAEELMGAAAHAFTTRR